MKMNKLLLLVSFAVAFLAKAHAQCTPLGDPNLFGNSQWNVYAYNSGNGTLAGTDWNTNYSGYYTSGALNVNTESDWPYLGTPSAATNYLGCPVGVDNHSYSAKRQGFPCGYYSLSVPNHVDAMQLYVNETKVWEHDGCCDSHTGVWSGWLGTNDKVELRGTAGGGGSLGRLEFVLNNTITNGNPTVFGNNQWNVYAFNSGNGTISGTDWTTNYVGFYSSTLLNFNTEADWGYLASPSAAANYQGCPVQVDLMSYVAKRQGFNCGYYSVDVQFHDDAAQLFINGSKVWEHDSCCDNHNGVWSGWLGANDKIEYRISEGGGGSAARLVFNKLTGTVIYVKATAAAGGNGTSWNSAFNNLQDALAMARTNSCINQIWVTGGTYKPTQGLDRNQSFVLVNNVAVYGGFAGTEAALTERNIVTNPTILSGEIGNAGIADNSYRIINNTFTSGAPLTNTAVLDGFVIEGANADAFYPDNLGGGMFNKYASPVIRNCIFRNNKASGGGGIYNENSGPSVFSCLFLNNTAIFGSAIYNSSGAANTKITNCTMYGNIGRETVYNEGFGTINNCIIWGNSGSIFSGAGANYSIVQGGSQGTGNLNLDPEFADAANGDFRLTNCSRAVDAGSNAEIAGINTDITGGIRNINGRVDMGAYELQTPQASVTLFVNKSASAGGNGRSWTTAFQSLQDALAYTKGHPCVNQIWVAAGTYKPTTGTDQTKSFTMINNVAIYGGFAGGETSFAERNITANKTILSGDLNDDDLVSTSDAFFVISNNIENSLCVINNSFTSGNPLNNSAVLDGFTIKGGNGIAQAAVSGAGMLNVYASPTLNNLIFINNSAMNGGAIFNNQNSSPIISGVDFVQNASQNDGGAVYSAGNSNPAFTNVNFRANRSQGTQGGGAVYCSNNSPLFNKCQFTGNYSNYGGAMGCNGATVSVSNCYFANNSVTQTAGCIYIKNSTVNLTNSIFSGNSATFYGGVIEVYSAVVNAINCVFWNNSVRFSSSGILYNGGTNPVVSINNCIIWNNHSVTQGVQPTINYSIVQGGFAGTGNINQSPRFIDADNNNFRLQSCSPAINSGSNAALPMNVTTDADNNNRIFGGTVDMGTYEFQAAPLPIVPVPAITTNNALNFDGVNDYAMLVRSCGNGTPLVNGGDAITIEYWFKGSVLQSAVRLQPDNDNYIVSGHFGEHILSNDGGSSTGSGLPIGANATDGNWHHVAMTWERGAVNGFKSYLDGVLVAQRNAANTPLPIVDGGAYLGAFNGNSQFMNGSLDEVRIWNVARTQAQIQAGLCGISLPQTGLLASYTFDHGTANGNNTGLAAGLRNMVQSDYYNGQLSGFAFNGTTSNWVNISRTQRLYVNANQTPASVDGLSWQSAFTNLQDALNYSCNSAAVEIWVAEGTYKPSRDPFGNNNPADPRDKTFFIRDGLKIYGGFAGTENSLNQRVTGAHATILSGDIDNNNVLDNGNAYHVVVVVAPTSNAKGILLDGCTVTGGNANGTGFIDVNFNTVRRSSGGGILLLNGPNTISNNIFSANAASSRAGAMSVSQGTQSIINNYFSNNNSQSGGAMFLASSSSTLIGNRFAANSSNDGGAVAVDGGTNGFTNNVFIGNTATGNGGAVNAEFATATFINNSLSGNSANRGGAVFNSSSTLTYTNNIIWGNGSTVANSSGITSIGGTNNVTYSLVQGGFAGTGNLNVNPLFVQQPSAGLGTSGNLRLQACSPAINAGLNSAVPVVVTTDVDGNSRVYNNATVDLGAYEYQGSAPPKDTTTTVVNLCSNQLPYSWNNNNYNTTGIYYATLNSINGCDSIVRLVLTVNQPTTSDTTAAVCNKFTWKNVTYNFSGDYEWKTTNAAGCDSIRTLHLTILSVTSTTSKTDAVCAASATGSITVNPTYGVRPFTYRIGTVGSYVANNVFTNLKTGKYTVSILDSNGCAGITNQVTILQPPAQTGTITKTDALCFGTATGSVSVTPTNGTAPFTYRVGSTGSYGTSNVFSALKAGKITAFIKDANGCTGSVVTTILQPARIAATSSVTNESCPNAKNGSITINPTGGTPPYTFRLGTTGAFVPSNTFTGLKAGIYRIFVNDANNCSGYSISTTVGQTSPTCTVSTRSMVVKPEVHTKQQGLTILLSPNPSNTYFTIRVKSTNQSTVQIRVMDVNGRSLFSAKGLPEQVFRFGENFAPGVYMIEVRQGDDIRIMKAVKLR